MNCQTVTTCWKRTKLPWILLPFQFPFYAAGVPEVVKLKNQWSGGETRTRSLDHPQISRPCLFLASSYDRSFALILLVFLRQQILVFRFPVLPLLAAWSQNKEFLTNHHSCFWFSQSIYANYCNFWIKRIGCDSSWLIIKLVNMFLCVSETG